MGLKKTTYLSTDTAGFSNGYWDAWVVYTTPSGGYSGTLSACTLPNVNHQRFLYETGPDTWVQHEAGFKLETNSGGVKTLIFQQPLETNWGWYCITTSSTPPSTAIPEYQKSNSTWKTFPSDPAAAKSITISNVNMLPNKTYYFYVYVPYVTWDGTAASDAAKFTASGTYGEPGTIIANNADFGSAVSMSYASATSGATYTVKVSVPTTSGTPNVETLQTKSSASSRSWTPALATYAPLITNSKSVTATITVQTYFGNELAGTRTKTITLSFTSAQVGPTLASGAFAISAVGDAASHGFSGYVQGYSKIRATYTSSKVTLKNGATVSKWTVKFGSAAAVNVAAGTATKDSAVISETTAVTCTLVDSRGFTASQSFTATIIPYQAPSLTCTVKRSNSSGTAADDGTYMRVDFSATYARVESGSSAQNTMTIKFEQKLASVSSYTNRGNMTGGTITQNGTDNIYAKSNHRWDGFADAVYNIRVTATDKMGNTSVKTFTIQSAMWALHIRNKGKGAAIGKAAEADNQMQIPSGWKYYRGAYKVLDTQDLQPKSVTLTKANPLPSFVSAVSTLNCRRAGYIVQVYVSCTIASGGGDSWATIATGCPVPAIAPIVNGRHWTNDTQQPSFFQINTSGELQVAWGAAGTNVCTLVYIANSL